MLFVVLAAGLAGAAPAELPLPSAVRVPPPAQTAGANAAPASELEAFMAEGKEWVLHGRRLPSDYRLRLARMRPADRIQALIFLRRAGLLTGKTWGVQDLLADTNDQKDAQ